MFGWLKQIVRGADKAMDKAGEVLDHPLVSAGIQGAALFLPPLQALKMLKVYQKVKEVEETWGRSTGPQKFLAVWQSLDGEYDSRELKKWIELSVQVLHGQLTIHNNQTGSRIQNFQPMEVLISGIVPLDK